MNSECEDIKNIEESIFGDKTENGEYEDIFGISKYFEEGTFESEILYEYLGYHNIMICDKDKLRKYIDTDIDELYREGML